MPQARGGVPSRRSEGRRRKPWRSASIYSAMMALPLAWSARLAPIGRSSLVIYVAHLPLVYGWSTFPGMVSSVGRVLSPAQVLSVAAILLVGGLGLADVLRRAGVWMREARSEKGPEAAPSV